MKNILEFKCFIASPGDTIEERNICEEVFSEINDNLGEALSFKLSTLRWENNVHPGVAEYSQQVINRQMDGNYDLFVGIMKTRFGTPTPQAGSGTEEEFNIAYEKHERKEIDNLFFYFGNPSVPVSEINVEQLQKVRKFRSHLENLGVLYGQYEDINDFKKQLKQDFTNYFVKYFDSKKIQKKQNNKEDAIIKAKVTYFEYRKLWLEIRNSKNISKKNISEIKRKGQLCRFSKAIFSQEQFINKLMVKEPLTEENAYLFALAVKDIGQIPSYYVNYHKDDEELNKQPIWMHLIERENTLNGSIEALSVTEDDWAIYEQIQRCLFNLDFTKSKDLLLQWNAKGHWIQNKAMRMAVYEDHLEEAQQLLDDTIKKEMNPAEKLYEIILANFISRKWTPLYSTDDFWKYDLNGQGDMLNFMMSELYKKNKKTKRRKWIGSTWNLGNNNGDYVKSLRILQFIIDSGIYVSIPGTYIFDIASWYIVFQNLYEFFPYPCFFYSIQYNDKDVQRRIGEEYAYSEKLQYFNKDILLKSLVAVGSENTPISLKNGILNVTATMYVAVDETIWFNLFKETIFKDFLKELYSIKDSAELVFNVKLALGSIKNPDNISWCFQQLISRYSINEKIVSDIIVYNLRINHIQNKTMIDNTLMFSDVFNGNSLNLLGILNEEGFLSKACIESICESVCNTDIENLPNNRVALFQMFNLIKYNEQALDKVKQCFLSMNIWHCGVLKDNEFGWTEPMYIRLSLLNDKITWTDEEFEIIKANLIKNVSIYNNASKTLHKDALTKIIQVRYLSDMLKFIDGLSAERHQSLLETRKEIERLLFERSQYADNIDLMMSDQSAEVDYAFENIYNGVVHNGIEGFKADVDFLIDRAIMKTPIALTRNLECIKLIVIESSKKMMRLGYTKKLNKLLSVYKDSDSWSTLDLRFAFNYLHDIAQTLKQNGESNDAIDFWMKNTFVNKFVVND